MIIICFLNMETGKYDPHFLRRVRTIVEIHEKNPKISKFFNITILGVVGIVSN